MKTSMKNEKAANGEEKWRGESEAKMSFLSLSAKIK